MQFQVKCLLLALVLTNAVLIGIRADHHPDSVWWDHIEVAFVSLFALEVLYNAFTVRPIALSHAS